MSRSTKTTFLLTDGLRRRLKTTAARTGRSVTDLLVEGAEHVLSVYEGKEEKEQLAQRAAAARESLREGFYEGPGISDRIDSLLYAAEGHTPYGDE
jgi:plasmid stability protein